MYYQEFIKAIPTFLDYIKVERKLSAHTQRAYTADLEQFADWWKNILTHEPASTFVEVAKQYSVALYKQPLDKKTVARKLSCLSSFTKFLKTQGISIQLELKRPVILPQVPISLSVQHLNILLESIDEELPTRYPYRDKAILELLYATGIRSSELVNIKISNIDIAQKTITIVNRKKVRTVVFHTTAQERLLRYIEYERPIAQDHDEHFFLNPRGLPMSTRSIQRICTRFRSFLLSNNHLTPHTLRHSCASHLLQRGADKTLVQELLGFSTLISTEKYISSKQTKNEHET